MNCFNIRELQSILKNKFFTDLVNSHDHRDLLSQSMIGLRFKKNNNLNLDLDITSFYKFGLHDTNINKYYNFSKVNTSSTAILSTYDAYFLSMFQIDSISLFKNYMYALSINFLELFNLFTSFTFVSFFEKLSVFNFFKVFLLNFNFLNVFNFSNPTLSSINDVNNLNLNNHVINLGSKSNLDTVNIFSESSSDQRYTRFNTVFVNYDYKTGHYIGN
jgi:hypothetical protein